MEYIQGLAVQTRIFAYFFALGFLMGLLYDALRIVRVLAFPQHKNVFILDAVFGCLSAFITFVCLLVLNYGQIQPFIIAAMGFGALVYILSLGGVMTRFRRNLLWAKRKTIETAVRPVKFLNRKIKATDAKIMAGGAKLLEKISLFVKNRLHSDDELRYNIDGNEEDAWVAELLEEESRATGGKVYGKGLRAKVEKATDWVKSKTSKKTAQQIADDSGAVDIEYIYDEDDFAPEGSDSPEELPVANPNRGIRAFISERILRKSASPNRKRK